MLAQILLVILAIILIIAMPILTILVINFLLTQMFASFIPLQLTIWNWLCAFFINGMFASSGISKNS